MSQGNNSRECPLETIQEQDPDSGCVTYTFAEVAAIVMPRLQAEPEKYPALTAMMEQIRAGKH